MADLTALAELRHNRGLIADPEGNKWMIATHKADYTEAQMMEAMRKMAPQGAGGGDAAAAAAGSEPEQ